MASVRRLADQLEFYFLDIPAILASNSRPMSRSRGRALVGAGLQVLLSLKASRAAIAFREARARPTFGHTFEPVAIVACLTVKAVAGQYDPGQDHDNDHHRKVINHSHPHTKK
jgi:hypothetical protein